MSDSPSGRLLAACETWKPGGFAYVKSAEAWPTRSGAEAEVKVKVPGSPEPLVIRTEWLDLGISIHSDVFGSRDCSPIVPKLVHWMIKRSYDARTQEEAKAP